MADHALYLEVDEDITSAIDKLRKAPGASVQIVVPKRSGLMQSVINLKLLKKAAADSGKSLVLVTNDRVAGDLAGRVGIAIAAAVGGRPVIKQSSRIAPSLDQEDVIDGNDPISNEALPESAALAESVTTSKRPAFLRRDIDKPASPIPATAASLGAAELAGEAGAEVSEGAPAPSTSKVPSFSKLQRRLAWAGLAVFLIIGYIVGNYFFASANVKLYAVGSKVSVDGAFVADTAATSPDNTNGVLPAQTINFAKDATAPVAPTGKKDDGTKSQGTVTVYNSYDASPHPLQAGTRFVAPDGKVFRTTADAVVPGAGVAGGKIAPGSTQIPVLADQNGDTYNEASGQKYTIPALPADQQAQIYGIGSQMSGGTSKISPVVLQGDVDKAVNDFFAKDVDAANTALAAKLSKGAKILPDTLLHSALDIAASPAVGQEATAATVSFKASYTELSVDGTIFKDYVHALEQKQIGSNNQIYDDGIGALQLTSTGKDASGRPGFHFSLVAYGGAKLDNTAIATALKGKKYGDATTYAGGLPGVDHVEINVWPAWSTSLPMRAQRIHVTVSVASKG